MKKLFAAILALFLLLPLTGQVKANGPPELSYELLMTDSAGRPVNDLSLLSPGEQLNIEILLNRTDSDLAYSIYGIEFRLLSSGLSYNGDGQSLRKGTKVQKLSYLDGSSVGFAWYDMSRKGEEINASVSAGCWSYTVVRPRTAEISVPVSLIYVRCSTADNIPSHSVVFELDTDGGRLRDEDPSGIYPAGISLILPRPTKDGYSFVGWDDGFTTHYPGEELTLNTSLSLQAMWVLKDPDWKPAYTLDWLITDRHINYLSGYPDGTVRPNNNITRAEAALIFHRLLTEDARESFGTSENPFSDIPDGAWYSEAVSTLCGAGILTGYPDGTFRPHKAISRAELAAMIHRFARVDGGVPSFSDAQNHWAQKSIAAAEAMGWIRGYPDGSFRPDRSITRAEAVAVINRLLGRFVRDSDSLLPGMETFSDNSNTSAWYYLDIQEAANNHAFYRFYGSRYEKWTRLLKNIDY